MLRNEVLFASPFPFVSQLAGAALAEIVDGLIGEPVEFTGHGVALDLLIESRGIKWQKPTSIAAAKFYSQ